MSGQIRVKQIRSGIGYPRKQRETLRGLGLKRMHQCRILEDTPEVRGMVKKISHLVRLEKV